MDLKLTYNVEMVLLENQLQNHVDDAVPEKPDSAWTTKDGKAHVVIGLPIEESENITQIRRIVMPLNHNMRNKSLNFKNTRSFISSGSLPEDQKKNVTHVSQYLNKKKYNAKYTSSTYHNVCFVASSTKNKATWFIDSAARSLMKAMQEFTSNFKITTV